MPVRLPETASKPTLKQNFLVEWANEMKRVVFFILACIIVSAAANAAQYPYIYKGQRPMGMGGAFVAVSDDANALFYNPAGLAAITQTSAAIFPLEIEVGEKGYKMYDDASDVDFDNETQTAAFLRDYVGERAHLGVNLFSSYSMPRFALGLIGTSRVDLEVRDRQYPRLTAKGVYDLGAGAGYGMPFFDDTLLAGFSLKYINRHSLDKVYTIKDIVEDDFNDLVKDDLEDGGGVLLDMGIIYKFDEMGMPGFKAGVSVNNLIGHKLGDARDVDEHVDMGVAYDYTFWIVKSTFAMDYIDVFSNLEQDDDFAKKIRLGAEFRFPKFLTLRAGLYQGYLTSGVSLDAKYARLDLTTYAEEIGAYAGQRADRRYCLMFVLGF